VIARAATWVADRDLRLSGVRDNLSRRIDWSVLDGLEISALSV
jgi:hypothetical protein